MKANYYQKGEVLEYTPAEKVEAGQVVALGSRVGVAAEDIAAGQPGHIHVVGVFAMAKAEGEAITQGAAVSYDSAADAVKAAGDGDTAVGYAAADAAAADATVLVKLLG